MRALHDGADRHAESALSGDTDALDSLQPARGAATQDHPNRLRKRDKPLICLASSGGRGFPPSPPSSQELCYISRVCARQWIRFWAIAPQNCDTEPQYRPRQPVHQRRIHRRAVGQRHRDQHGRQGIVARQRLCRAALAFGQIEEVYLRAYDSVSEARTSIGRYLDFYNRKRPHSSLDARTPDRAYFGNRACAGEVQLSRLRDHRPAAGPVPCHSSRLGGTQPAGDDPVREIRPAPAAEPLGRALCQGRRAPQPVDFGRPRGACTAAVMPLFRRLEAHVMAAERLHGDDTTVPAIAKGRTAIGRIWVYVRDDKPFGGSAPPASVFYHSPDRAGEHPQASPGPVRRNLPGRRLWRIRQTLRSRSKSRGYP